MITSGSAWADILTLVGVIALVYVVAVWISLVVWTYRDVQHRSLDQNERTAAVLLVAIFSVAGWLVYLLLRPSDTLDDVRIETLQEQLFARELSMVQSCTRCRRRVNEDFLVCPFCREELRAACTSCERPVSLTWDACAYCGAATPRSRTAASRPAPAAEPRRAARPRPLVPREAR